MHKNLCGAGDYIQYNVFRYPSERMFPLYQSPSTSSDPVEVLRPLAAECGWNLIPMLEMSDGMHSAVLEEGCGGAQ